MAVFNNGFPQPYPQLYPQNYQPNQQIPQVQQTQNGGFIPVPSEDVARNYPVAPGNSVTFKNENAPYVYTKTMGFSQLDRPIFEKYKLVREEDTQTDSLQEEDYESIIQDLQHQIQTIKEDVSNIRSEINVLKGQLSKPTTTKKKVNGGT